MRLFRPKLARWLVALADPAGPRVTKLPRPIRVEQIIPLCDLADRHRVLPIVLTNLRALAAAGGLERVVRRSGRQPEQARQQFDQALAEAGKQLPVQIAYTMAIREQVKAIGRMLAERQLPAMMLKGPDFADRLYPSPSMRVFVDLDLLVPRAAMPDIEAAFKALGYTAEPQPDMKYDEGYGERSYLPPHRPGAVVEVHWNLVNSPTLRQGVSVSFEDVPREESGTSGADGWVRPSPAGQLLVAAVHAATGHGFDRLQMLCDICQIARGRAGAVDHEALRSAAFGTGSAVLLAKGLDLAWQFFAEPACDALLERLNFRWRRRWLRLVISPDNVLNAQTRWRCLGSFRRQWFRHSLKKRRGV